MKNVAINILDVLRSNPVAACAAGLCALSTVLLLRWLLVGFKCRCTSRLHFEATLSFSNWRVLVSVLVAMGLLAISFAPNIGNLQIPSLGLACCLLGATGILGGTEFREYGIMAGGVLIPWSRVKRVTWIDHGNASTMWVKAAGCFPLAVRVSAVNKHAVDRLVHSAARYERFPVAYWLGNLVTRSVIAILVAVGVLAILV